MEKVRELTLEEQIFHNHYNYYKDIGIETIKQQAGQVEQVSSDYQGRVIYELLQNAFDKAQEKILVKVIGDSLYVANDGTKFNFTSNYDYKNGSLKRGDFQSLCSISTSTKNASTSIGNKGVGFKSAFSIANDGFVNVFTRGEIILNEEKIEENISFRIYDSFKDVSSLPQDFNKEILENLTTKINLVQHERGDRGVPGYYFPQYIENEDDIIKELFNDGFVTVIEIPFENKEEVKKLFEEIKNIHFQFIQLKYPDYPSSFEIKFDFDNDEHLTTISKNTNKIFSARIENEEIKSLAKEAGIQIEKPEVAFYIKEEPQGLLYNYLPTQVKSPFKYIDFHADFHTTVDRKSINFDGEKIGAYNRALFKACIELFFTTINSYLSVDDKAELALEFTESSGEIYYNLNWKILEYNSSFTHLNLLFPIVQKILNISNFKYQNSVLLFSNLAKKYFDTNDSGNEIFIRNSLSFIDLFSTIHTSNFQPAYEKINKHKQEFAQKLLELKVNVIPNMKLDIDSELLFREKSNEMLKLPEFMGINITDFDIKDKEFKKGLGIKDFTDNNEILKYFKQCSFTGEYSNKSISEEQQKDLIKNLFIIFNTKKENKILSTHRITKAITNKDRENNSSTNQANFNISTIFLKTKWKTYKPAQLCLSSEIDNEFINECIVGNNNNEFLKFLGVSLDSDYIYADGRLYDKLKKGLNYIPILLDRKVNKEDISAELIKNLYIISTKGEKKHPSTINNGDYKFLDKILKPSLKLELANLLISKYDLFPKEYRDILQDRISNSLTLKFDAIRLYQRIFQVYEKGKIYLVIENEKLSWTKILDFSIVSSKADFDLCIQIPNKKILCYHSSQNLSDFLTNLIVKPVKGEISIKEAEINLKWKKDLEEKIIYILLSISSSKNSEIDYLDDEKDLFEIQNKIESLKIIEVSSLEQKIYFQNDFVTSDKNYAFDDKKTGELYFIRNSNKRQIATGISDFIFNNISITESVELILFHKTIEDLKLEYDKNDIAILQKKWKKDYSKRFLEFQNEIFKLLGKNKNDDEKWFIYNASHKSKFLIEIDNLNQLAFLKELILTLKCKKEFEGYFDIFELEIDSNEIYERISKINLKLDLVENDSKKDILIEFNSIKIKLGCESEIEKIEEKIEELFPSNEEINNSKLDEKKEEIKLEKKIEDIFNNLNSSISKGTVTTAFNGSTASNHLKAKIKKAIFQNNGSNNVTNEDLELMGATGEERVLSYFIKDFLKLKKAQRIKGINAVYALLKNKVNNNSMEKFRDKCLTFINKDEELQRALIPLFYVTMHHKYSYFDLIVYKDNQPTLIEVKTTYSDNNNRFFLSIAEIDAARGKDKYEIVRDSPSCINFLGNPIKLVEKDLASISGENFTLTPRNYEFKFKS